MKFAQSLLEALVAAAAGPYILSNTKTLYELIALPEIAGLRTQLCRTTPLHILDGVDRHAAADARLVADGGRDLVLRQSERDRPCSSMTFTFSRSSSSSFKLHHVGRLLHAISTAAIYRRYLPPMTARRYLPPMQATRDYHYVPASFRSTASASSYADHVAAPRPIAFSPRGDCRNRRHDQSGASSPRQPTDLLYFVSHGERHK